MRVQVSRDDMQTFILYEESDPTAQAYDLPDTLVLAYNQTLEILHQLDRVICARVQTQKEIRSSTGNEQEGL